MIAAVAEDVDNADDAPALKFAEAGADVRTRNGEDNGDLVGGERARRDEEQSVDLSHGAIDTPTSAHFAPVEDEFLGGGGEWRTLCVFSHFCMDRTYSSDWRLSIGKLTWR